MIISAENLNLSSSQLNLIKSGWGTDAVEKVILKKITYLSDGLKVKGYVAHPVDENKKYPCIIWCRGGYGNAGALDDFNAQGILGQIASWGYFVLETQYRGNDGGEGQDEFGGNDVNDILNLFYVAEEFSVANTSVWGIEGWSRGGMMTYLTLTKTNKFGAAIVNAGITNLSCNVNESKFMKHLYDNAFNKLDGNDFETFCSKRSVINFADKLPKSTPLLLLHGTADSRVLPHDSIDLAYKLLDLKFPFRLVLFENGDHFLKPHKSEADKLRKHWFDVYLKNKTERK